MTESASALTGGMFKFTWDATGPEGDRGGLGPSVPISVYRMMMFSMLDVLSSKYGREAADGLFREAGYVAGREFASRNLDLSADFNGFIAMLRDKMLEFCISNIKLEFFDHRTGEFDISVSQDAGRCGQPAADTTVCVFDEGFITGIVEAYTKKQYKLREVDCWANGSRDCLFRGVILEQQA